MDGILFIKNLQEFVVLFMSFQSTKCPGVCAAVRKNVEHLKNNTYPSVKSVIKQSVVPAVSARPALTAQGGVAPALPSILTLIGPFRARDDVRPIGAQCEEERLTGTSGPWKRAVPCCQLLSSARRS